MFDYQEPGTVQLHYESRAIKSYSKADQIEKPVRRWCSIDDYLFFGVFKLEISKVIAKFRSIEIDSLKKKMGLVGLCRAIIVLYGKYLKFINFFDDTEIPQYAIDLHAYDFKAIMIKNKYDRQSIDYSYSDLRKLSILIASSISWKKLISLIRTYFPEGLFHNFSLAESLFLICIHPKKPNAFELLTSQYKKDVSLYIDCLAAAIQTLMQKICQEINISYGNKRNNESMFQRILFNFLDFFDDQQKLGDESYFNKLRTQNLYDYFLKVKRISNPKLE